MSGGWSKILGFTRVWPTKEETQEYRDEHDGRSPSRTPRVRCDKCQLRMWGSGFGIASHRRKGCIAPQSEQETMA
jgi:hypothetical protein